MQSGSFLDRVKFTSPPEKAGTAAYLSAAKNLLNLAARTAAAAAKGATLFCKPTPI